MGYLEVRESPVGTSSPGLVFPQKCFQNEGAWLSFTASLISAALAYKDIIYRYFIIMHIVQNSLKNKLFFVDISGYGYEEKDIFFLQFLRL